MLIFFYVFVQFFNWYALETINSRFIFFNFLVFIIFIYKRLNKNNAKIYKIKKNKINFFYLKPFKDKRGSFYELYNKKLFNKKIKIVFVEDDLSISKKRI